MVYCNRSCVKVNEEIELMKKVYFDKDKYFIIVILVIFIIYISVIRYNSNCNYYNSNATWHTLFTLKCYDETSSDVHKYLPIVTLGNADDKGIPWGAAVPDDKGNYYYTSFSPAGYVLPYIFMKVFHLQISEESLYIFNTMLFILSGIVWMYFIKDVFSKSAYVHVLSFIALITYISSPEILHGQGMVYWHQSIMQISLVLQFIMYHNMYTKKTRCATVFFYILCVINPYIEWTGYVANVGFALTEIIRNWNDNRKRGFIKAMEIILLTVIAFLLFVGHYLLVIDISDFLNVLFARFTARSISATNGMFDIFRGYFESFLYCWLLLLVFMLWDFIIHKRVSIKNKLVLLMLAFPCFENFIMKQHALIYSYDRMKLVYVLSFLICMCADNILSCSKKNSITKKILIGFTIIIGMLNINSYISNNRYMWRADYRNSNKLIASHIEQKYDNAVFAVENDYVRGYLSMLFGEGIYERLSLYQTSEIVKNKCKKYAIVITVKKNDRWQMSEVEHVTIYDITNRELITVLIDEEQMEVVEKVLGDTYLLADFTDENWTNGYSNYSNMFLLERTDDLLILLKTKQKLICNGEEYYIENIDYDDKWIRVTVDGEISECMYSQSVTFIE